MQRFILKKKYIIAMRLDYGCVKIEVKFNQFLIKKFFAKSANTSGHFKNENSNGPLTIQYITKYSFGFGKNAHWEKIILFQKP